MTLIKSISGIRGTIGGKSRENLTPNDIVKFTSAFAEYIIETTGNYKVVIGRDGRISGEMIKNIVVGTLQGMGVDVVDIGFSTTPTVELAVPAEGAGGGIIITASHNPGQWNALKLLNKDGEFISAADGQKILEKADKGRIKYAEANDLGKYELRDKYLQEHINKILKLELVDVNAIKEKKFKIVVDCVNSTGGLVVPQLLYSLGVKEVVELFCEVTGKFPHNPEPLPESLSTLAHEVNFNKAHLGIAVDPDVDRLAIVNEDGSMFGEEYTLVAVADYVLKNKKGNTVSNMSSTRALQDITLKAGGEYFPSAVGEVNVVEKMKEVNAVIGGEGNGGIIYPELHYGRDALVGIALFLTHLAKFGKSSSMLRSKYPNYHMSKNKITLTNDVNLEEVFKKIKSKYSSHPINDQDGLKIDFDRDWVHLRRSNTEPIIRIYTESQSETTALSIANKLMEDIRNIIKNKD